MRARSATAKPVLRDGPLFSSLTEPRYNDTGARMRLRSPRVAVSLVRFTLPQHTKHPRGINNTETNMPRNTMKNRGGIARVAAGVLLATTLAARAVIATTFMSVEPIPGGDVVDDDVLAVIESTGYANLELWSNRLLNECAIVQNVIDALVADGAISTVNAGNTSVGVAAGGFEGTTHPSYVFTMRDTGTDPVSAADVDVLDNALGYVLNQEGTAHFSPDNFKAYAFKLDYAVVTFSGALDGEDPEAFFEHVGSIDPALFSGQFAGFTQIVFQVQL
jgi:hypothetical protein